MSLADIPPKLVLEATLSHPAEDVRVLGFRGRDTHYGRDAFVLKAEELPVIREQPAVTHFVVPNDVAAEAISTEQGCYILGEHTVYYAGWELLTKSGGHTGRKYGEEVPGRAVQVDAMRTWPRASVEVSN